MHTLHTVAQATISWGDFQFGLATLVAAVVVALLLDWLVLNIIEH